MSYSFTAGPATKADIMTDLDHAAADLPEGNADAERDDHLRAIGDAVRALFPVVGTDEDRVSVSVSGHSNVEHAHSNEWADEMVTITVSVSPRQHTLTKDCWCNPESEHVA